MLSWPEKKAEPDADPIQNASRDNLLAEAIALTGWKGRTRQQMQKLLVRNRVEFEQAVANLQVEAVMGLSISRHSGHVDIVDKLCGLRYVFDPATKFEPNSEYLVVDRLSKHWFAFETDWN